MYSGTLQNSYEPCYTLEANKLRKKVNFFFTGLAAPPQPGLTR
jgi:hypothetical protein